MTRSVLRRSGLVGTVTLAVIVLVGVSTALLLFDPRTTAADALRTGGFAAGSLVAMYALWLNDRRRRVEEQRQDLEQDRTELDRERVSDERFARAVELLGHEADQVRTGAMHALAALASSNPGHTQTVVDVLCAYLRRPFRHPRYEDARDTADSWQPAERDDAERELQVRLAAQRLVVSLLPDSGTPDAPRYDLDLTGAALEYFDVSGKQIGTLVARYVRLFSSNNLSGCEIHGPALFTGASTGRGRLAGRFRCTGTVFHDRAWFSKVVFRYAAAFDRAHFHGPTRFASTVFHHDVTFAGAVFDGYTDFTGTRFRTTVDLPEATWNGEVLSEGVEGAADLPKGWSRVRLTLH